MEVEQKLTNALQYAKDKYNLLMYDENTQIHDEVNYTVKEFYDNLQNNMTDSFLKQLRLMEKEKAGHGSIHKDGVSSFLPESHTWKDGIIIIKE